jgi:hypothetical protein
MTVASMALICRRMNFCAGPELYHETDDWQRRQRSEKRRNESEESTWSRMICRAMDTHVSSSLA